MTGTRRPSLRPGRCSCPQPHTQQMLSRQPDNQPEESLRNRLTTVGVYFLVYFQNKSNGLFPFGRVEGLDLRTRNGALVQAMVDSAPR